MNLTGRERIEGEILLSSGIPYDEYEGLIVLAMVSVLFILVLVLSHLRKLGVGKEFAYGMTKGATQLFLIAVLLTFLFEAELWYFFIWGFLLAMVLVGGHTSAKRATGMPHAFEVTTPAILIGGTIVIIVLALTRAMPMEPQFIVPLSGMVFGNSMAICSLTLDRLLREVKLNKKVLESYLALGATPQQALETFGRMSIKAGLMPTIDRLKTLGIIFIPGAMSGLLMAGTPPIVAAEYQIIVYLMIVAGGIMTSILVTFLARKQIFTESEQLETWI